MIKKGFTLIELMVVVLIVGLLSGLVVVNVNNSRISSRDAKRKADMGTVSSALAAYYADQHYYPSGSYSTMITTLTPNYITLGPLDPLNPTRVYGYNIAPAGCTTANHDCSSYTLWADVEDDAHNATAGTYYAIKNGDESNTITP